MPPKTLKKGKLGQIELRIVQRDKRVACRLLPTTWPDWQDN